jgi:hypothetical protein
MVPDVVHFLLDVPDETPELDIVPHTHSAPSRVPSFARSRRAPRYLHGSGVKHAQGEL